jgi:predicted amidohydrolase YtcJ
MPMKARAIVAAWILAAMLLPAAYGSEAGKADLILTNAIVHPEASRDATQQAVAISGGAIAFVGSSAEAMRWRGPRTTVLDLHGRTVLPGLVDAHVHPAAGEFLNHRLCNVRGFTIEEGFAKVHACASKAPPGDWVVGYGWYDLDNAAFDKVTRKQLDELVPDRKLAIISRDRHTVWANSRTLAAFGIDRNAQAPAGGEIVRDPSGEPTGMLIDAAGYRIVYAIQHDSTYAIPTRELLRQAMSHLNSLGITSLLDANVDDDAAAAYQALDRAGELSMRVSLAMRVTPANYRERIPQIAATRDGLRPGRVRVDYVKVFADGNPEVNLSSLLNHDGPPETATPGYYTDEQMHELVALAERAGLSVFVHVIGDGAARQVLDAVEAARQLQPQGASRHTLSHLCWVADADLPRFKSLGVLANIQEGWLAPAAFGGPPGYDYARSTAAGPIGPWLAGRLMPYRSLAQAGALLAAGSDWFYTDENPWVSMEAGATSKDPGGTNAQAMLPNHTLDVATLMRARTSGGAYQMFLEQKVGTIEVGKRADLVVLAQDPLRIPVERLHETSVEMTLVDGEIVYRR